MPRKSVIKRFILPTINHPAVIFATITIVMGVLTFAGLPITIFTVMAFVVLTIINAYLINHRIIMQFYNKHDALTKLPNRQEFYRILDDLISRNINVCVLVMDLNNFKHINDTLGHKVGDSLLKKSSKRITPLLRKQDDIVARIGGDEFAVIMCNVPTEQDVMLVAKRLVDAFTLPFDLDDIQLEVNISVGVAWDSTKTQSATELMKHADIAMYVAKRKQLGYFVYDSTKDLYSLENLALPSDIKQAINNNEFEILSQPKINIKTKKIEGVEVLLRWHHPMYGLIMPEKFIGIAENIGYINDITIWLLQRVIEQQIIWKLRGIELQVSINVSANDLNDNATLIRLKDLIETSEINPNNLIFEITETAILTDVDPAMQHLTELSNLGVKLSIDDFGTGHSSFTYLKHLPIYEIKIDKSFVISINERVQDYNIVKSSITIAHGINCIVTAEGVEDIHTLDKLQELGCDVAQGHYYTKPLPIKEFDEWMEKYTNKGVVSNS